MWPAIKRFFTDETAFVRISRGLMVMAGGLVTAGALPIVPPVVGVVVTGLAVMAGAGRKAPPPAP